MYPDLYNLTDREAEIADCYNNKEFLIALARKAEYIAVVNVKSNTVYVLKVYDFVVHIFVIFVG